MERKALVKGAAMRGNVLLAVMTLAITVFVMVPVLVAGMGGGKPHRHRHAGAPGSISPNDLPQWHVRRVGGTDANSGQSGATAENSAVHTEAGTPPGQTV